MFLGVVDDGSANSGSHAGRAFAGIHGTSYARRSRGRAGFGGQSFARRFLHHFPFGRGFECGLRGAAIRQRHDALRQVHRRFAADVERMAGHYANIISGAHKSRGDGMEFSGWQASPESGGSPEPTDARLKDPAAVVVREPAPRLISDEGPSERGIEKPVAVIEGRPADAGSKGAPAVAKTADGIEAAVGVEVAEPGRVGGRIGILQCRVGGGGHAVCAAGNPAIEIIVFGKAAHGSGDVFSGAHGQRLAFGQNSGVILVHHVHTAVENRDSAAIVKIIQAKIRVVAGFRSEVAAGDAEIVAACGIHVERCGALAENEPGGERAVFQRKIKKFENAIFIDKNHGAVFEFHLGAAVVGGDDVVLANGKIEFRALPVSFVVGERIAFGIAKDANLTLHEAEADDAGVAGAGLLRVKREKKYSKDYKGRTAKKSTESHGWPLPGTQAYQAVRSTRRGPGTTTYGLAWGGGRQGWLR